MALQSTIFSPALNGSIPELYPEEYVTEANAFVKLVTTVAILLGIALAGVSLDITEGILPTITNKLAEFFNITPHVKIILFEKIGFVQLQIVAFVVILVSLIGLIASYYVNKHTAEKEHRPFPWFGPLNSVKDVFFVRKDPPLFFALIGSFFFYTISSLAVLVINKYGPDQLGFSKTLTSLMIVALMIGICIGSFVVAQISTNKTWMKMPGPSTLGFGLGFVLVASASYLSNPLMLKIALFGALIISGTFAGMLLIPIASFIQIRPAANEKGKILGAGNFLDFSGIFFSGFIFKVIDESLQPSDSFFMIGFISIVTGVLFKYVAGRKSIKL
jgi:acyl-[acyl-carrier-protein]-phospholipid O-acyltransferase/long-chain-fatty-acid--[acyl-carrier-protein] ligase